MCDGYTQKLFSNTAFSAGGRWLMVAVTSEAVLDDVERLIQVRRKIKRRA